MSPDEFFVMTESTSGTWFCADTIAHLNTVSGDGASAAEAGELCLAEVFGDEVDENL